MATQDQIDEVRQFIDETDDTGGWTDEIIIRYVDKFKDIYRASSEIWSTKAAQVARLVDVREGESSRAMSKMADNALKLARFYDQRSKESGPDPSEGGIVISRLTR